jgi:hypothetical protein
MKTDHRLTTAHRDLATLDLTIAALCKKFGDDVDEQDSYWAAEDRRSAALERLANIRATSPEGIRAKARALKQPDVEFSAWYAAIAASLADDVLRWFSTSG